jgi:hypothetical protein
MALEVEVLPPVTPEIQQSIERVQTFAAARIETPQQAQECADRIVFCRQVIKGILDYNRPIKEATDHAHRVACRQERAALDKVEPIKADHDRQLLDWDARQREALKEEQRRISEKLASKETDHVIEEAIRTGDDRVLDRKIIPPAVTVRVEKPTGVKTFTVPDFKVLDVTKLYPQFQLANDGLIRPLVRKLGKKAADIVGQPGAIEIFEKGRTG